MATVTELRDNGSTVTNVATPIIEPLAAQEIFGSKLRRFGDHYNTSQNSHLYRYLVALCGEAGAGSLKKELLLPKLFQRLESTMYLNLDRLYGDSLTLPRLSAEVYTVDPENQILTQTQWDDVKAKDAAYRERCLIWMRAILEGGTIEGLKLAAQAALGVECDIMLNPDATTAGIATTTSTNEFVIIPRTPTITDQDRRRLARLVDKLKPSGTLHTIYLGNDLRNARTILNADASSNRFYIKRLVTGRTDISWPVINPNDGLWIQGGVQNEAPTFAFMDRQESVTYITIDSTSASSEHIGLFNADQRSLFSNLARNVDDHLLYYSSSRSIANTIAPLNIQQSFVNTSSGEAHDTIVANLHYPLVYFTINGITPSQDDTPDVFWSSVEKLAPETDNLILNFTSARSVNFITWEMTSKPFDFVIEYDDSGVWKPVVGSSLNTYSLAMPYMPAAENPWVYFEHHFDSVTTTRLRVTFVRREDKFPLPSSDLIPYSVDIRGLRIMQIITKESDFVINTGSDILGNAYTTSFSKYQASYATDALATFWQSQPNPSKNAVESLYFDLRIGSHLGTQTFLDTLTQDQLDGRGQSNVELYYSDGQVVDEVFVDPVYPGANMKFYYSVDDHPVWDEKLWSPISRDYICKKGYHALPTPQIVRYFKIEFSNLPAQPYQPVEYPAMPKVRYRTFPTWVTDYFSTVYPDQPLPTSLEQIETLSYEPLDLFKKVDDRMGKTFEQMRAELEADHDPEVAAQIEELLAMQVDQAPQRKVEDQIRYNSVVMWQRDMMQQVDRGRALGRVATAARGDFTDTGFNAELGLPAYVPPLQQSVSNLTEAAIEKMTPPMWFPRKCRHGYKIVEGSIDSKVAYGVAIRTVQFHRRNYTVVLDEPVYIETLDDTAHVLSNDFAQTNSAYYIGQ